MRKMKTKTKAIPESKTGALASPVNLTVPVTGIAADNFQTVKTQTCVSANTEVARLILYPALALASKVGFTKYLQIMEQHGAVTTPATGQE